MHWKIHVVVCFCVGLWGSGLCKWGLFHFIQMVISSTDVTQIAGLNELERHLYCSLVFNWIIVMNRHVGGGHFVWQPQEEQNTEFASGHCLSLITSALINENQWCWPSRAPRRDLLYMLTGADFYATEADINRQNILQTFMALLFSCHLNIHKAE